MGLTIANLEVTPSQVSGRLATWHRLMEEAGLTYNDLQTPIDNLVFRHRLVKFWQTGGVLPQAEQPDAENVNTHITTLTIVSCFDRDMRNKGWTLLEDTSEPAEFDVSRLELVSFLEIGERYTGGETMFKRARGETTVNGQKLVGCNWGQRHGEALFRNQHQHHISVEWRDKRIVLPGTVWVDNEWQHHHLVPYYAFRDKQWVLDFHWLGHNPDSLYRLLRLRELLLAA